MRRRSLALAALAAALAGAWFAFDPSWIPTLAGIKARQAQLAAWTAAEPLTAAAAYFGAYVAAAALSIPGAALMTLLGGALFGLGWGVLLVSFASTTGATIAMLLARTLLREAVRARFADAVHALDRGLASEGAFYLIGLRLVPVFPFVAVNLLCGLTAMRVRTFWWASQLGMLPATAIYVNAGTELARLESLRDAASPGMLWALTLLAALPLAAPRVLGLWRDRRALARWPRPARFDANLVVIGAGAAGLVCAYVAAAVRARVVLIERERMGGECLNSGCVPSKALIRATRFLAGQQRAGALGIAGARSQVEFADLMRRVRGTIEAIAPHDSVERYTGLGVDCVAGQARITSPWTVEVGGRTIATRAIVIATGSRPKVPPLPGLDSVRWYTTDDLWSLDTLPRRLAVLGGGPIGCELAQCFARLGAQVSLVEIGPRLLPREDVDVSACLRERLGAEGIDVRTQCTPRAVRADQDGGVLDCTCDGESVSLAFDALLIATGRSAHGAGLGLEELGIGLAPSGTIAVDATLRTACPTVYACGDVAGPYQYTHAGAHQAWYAAVNALFGGLRRVRVDYAALPWVTFTDPEIARVGLNRAEALERGIAHETTRFELADLDRAIIEAETAGWVEVLTAPRRDRILGVTIVGAHAGEMIAEFALAMRHGLGLGKVLSTVHAYPTWMEANRYAAGAWRRAHAPAAALRLVERWHRWRRG
ncbi:MAG: FAD-dependent oxidoreductase [Gammaproteobacteria bacterium]